MAPRKSYTMRFGWKFLALLFTLHGSLHFYTGEILVRPAKLFFGAGAAAAAALLTRWRLAAAGESASSSKIEQNKHADLQPNLINPR